MTRKVLGERLREVRRRRGLTQQELGEAIGLSRTAVTNIEAGKQAITVDALLGAAKRIGCEAGDLLRSDPAPARDPLVLGIKLADVLPDGWRPEGVIVLVRAIDADGRRRTTQLEGGDVMLWEATGMLDAAARSYGSRLEALTATLDGKPL